MGWIEDNTNKDPMAKIGMRIRMLNMDDEQDPIDDGLEGTIVAIDDLGTLHVKWDDGRKLGVIPNIDEYQLLPSEDEQIDFDIFEEKNFKPVLKGSKSTSAGKKVTANWKSELSKAKPKPDIKIESEEVPGGEAENMTPKDLAKKHDVSVKDIEKEIEVGTKIEMEHTDSKKMAREIAMDHIAEFPDYYTNKKYGVKASEKGLEKELEETTTTGALGASPIQPLGSPIRNKKAKETSSYVITKGDLKNPLGKVYSLKSESKIIKAKDFISEISSTHASKLRNAEGTFDSDPWVGKKGWLRKDELAWEGGEIADILAKLDINWNDSNLSLTDKETDKINEGWLKKTKEDKLALEILERVKEEYPQEIKTGRFRYGGGDYIEFTLEGIRGRVRVRLENTYSTGDFRDSYGLWVNDRKLLASRWAIKKLYKYISKEFTKRKEAEDLKNIETDLISPDYAEDVFDMLGDSEQVNEVKKSKESPIHTKKWERCVKDVEKKNKENKTDYNPYAVCQKSIGYEGSIKKPHRRQEELEETTTFSSVFGGGFPVTPFMFAKKGKHIPSKKPIWKGGKIVQKADKADLLGESILDEINKVKWVKGGKFVKIKDKCAKYNNQPHCSQGAIDNPLQLSDTVFENIKEVSKKTGLSEKYILDKITNFLNEDTHHKLSLLDKLKIKLAGIDEDQVLYNLNNGLPIDWKGTKEGYYEKMEPSGNNNTGSN